MHKRQLISCYSCNFGDLRSYLAWEGKGTEEWGEKEKVARYRNPLLFISIPDWLSHNEWPLTCIKWETTMMQVSKEICSIGISFRSKDHNYANQVVTRWNFFLSLPPLPFSPPSSPLQRKPFQNHFCPALFLNRCFTFSLGHSHPVTVHGKNVVSFMLFGTLFVLASLIVFA